MTRLRPLFGLFVALAMTLTSVTVAVARGQPAPFLEMTICLGYGVTTISVDADGKPTAPVHPCPECIAGLAAIALPPAATPAPPSVVGRDLAEEPVVLPVSRHSVPPCARGPPAVPV